MMVRYVLLFRELLDNFHPIEGRALRFSWLLEKRALRFFWLSDPIREGPFSHQSRAARARALTVPPGVPTAIEQAGPESLDAAHSLAAVLCGVFGEAEVPGEVEGQHLR